MLFWRMLAANRTTRLIEQRLQGLSFQAKVAHSFLTFRWSNDTKIPFSLAAEIFVKRIDKE